MADKEHDDDKFNKWKGHLVDALCKAFQDAQQDRQSHIGIQEDALNYVESLIFEVLHGICSCEPHSVQDVEQYVQRGFPAPVNMWAITDAQESLAKAGMFRMREKPYTPVSKLSQILRDKLGYKLDNQICTYIACILDYIACDLLKLTGNYVRYIQHSEITMQDLRVTMKTDPVMMEIFCQEESEASSSAAISTVDWNSGKRSSMSYEDAVKATNHKEEQYLRDLRLILHVFGKLYSDYYVQVANVLDSVFQDLYDIQDTTMKLLDLFEDVLEMNRESTTQLIGGCFLEMAEGAEFDVYERYSKTVLVNPDCMKAFRDVLEQKSFIKEVQESKGSGFYLAVKYVLPKLLYIPITHVFWYFEVVQELKYLTKAPEDKEDLEQTESSLVLLKNKLEPVSSEFRKKKLTRMNIRCVPDVIQQHSVNEKLRELKESIDYLPSMLQGEDIRDILYEGHVIKIAAKGSLGPGDTLRGSRSRPERFAILFDSVLILCKPRLRGAGTLHEYRAKEKIRLRRFEVRDRTDLDDLSWEICPIKNLQREPSTSTSTVLSARSFEEKQDWMAAIVLLQTRSMLERMLDNCLKDEKKRRPPLLPSPDEYKFAVKDTEENIIFEDYTSSSGLPVVKGATLIKLVERLTYTGYGDQKFMKTFFTTYRSFCSPQELLNHLVMRFQIPDPPPNLLNGLDGHVSPAFIEDPDVEYREGLKLFRKDYVLPIQKRVLAAVRHWVDHHWYDFEMDENLLQELKTFLKGIQGHAHVMKWTQVCLKIIERKESRPEEPPEFSFNETMPPVEWFITRRPEEYNLMTLHPLELARQVTLFEFEMYRAVKPVELHDAAFNKPDKAKRSPQLMKLTHFSTDFIYWMERCIVEVGNVDERVAVMNRILEISVAFFELNNFNGLLEIYSVCESSSVHRLNFTWSRIETRLYRMYERMNELFKDHLKQYRIRLRSINPPCVPFFGHYLTNLTFLDEGNPTFLKIAGSINYGDMEGGCLENGEATLPFVPPPTPNLQHQHQPKKQPLISFSKCRKIAETIAEIQMYQHQPYCLRPESSIRNFLENLNPYQGFNGKEELANYLWSRSLEIEPRDADKVPIFPPTREYQLKSPGIRPKQVVNKLSKLPSLLTTPTPEYNAQRHHSSTLPQSSTRSEDITRLERSLSPAGTASNHEPVMGIVEINPGESPRYVEDVRYSGPPFNMSSSVHLPTGMTHHSHTLPTMDIPGAHAHAAAVDRNVSATFSGTTFHSDNSVPPIPPRPKRFPPALPFQPLSGNPLSGSNELSPPLPPKPPAKDNKSQSKSPSTPTSARFEFGTENWPSAGAASPGPQGKPPPIPPRISPPPQSSRSRRRQLPSSDLDFPSVSSSPPESARSSTIPSSGDLLHWDQENLDTGSLNGTGQTFVFPSVAKFEDESTDTVNPLREHSEWAEGDVKTTPPPLPPRASTSPAMAPPPRPPPRRQEATQDLELMEPPPLPPKTYKNRTLNHQL